jgi:hypothetical protein
MHPGSGRGISSIIVSHFRDGMDVMAETLLASDEKISEHGHRWYTVRVTVSSLNNTWIHEGQMLADAMRVVCKFSPGELRVTDGLIDQVAS